MNMLKFLKKKISLGDTYGVNTGDYVGEMLTFIKESDTHYYFLSMPKMENREIAKEKFDFGKDHNIIEFVEKLPGNICKVVKAQFEQNI